MSEQIVVDPFPDLSLMVKQVRYFAETQPTRKVDCTYVDGEGEPVCIIGHALHALGYTTNWTATGPDGRTVVNEENLNGLTAITGYDPTDPRTVWLAAVQDWQDGNYSWAKAVEMADFTNGHVE